MSKLDELIKELCPDGVEYKRFDEVCSLHARIGWQRLTRAEYRNQGEYLLITGTDFNSDYTINYDTCVFVDKERFEQDKKIQLQDGDVLITKDGTLGKVAQVVNLPKPATLNGGVFVVRSIDGQLLQRYILHFLMSGKFRKEVFQKKTGSTISHLTQGLFSRIKIPVPPLEVQREIVKILDNFTELTARKKQYEYYRNRLLTFDKENITYKKLKETCWLKSGKAISSNDISSEKSAEYPFACYGGNGIRGYVSQFIYDLDCPIIGRQGALCGNVQYALGKFYPTEHAVVVRSKGEYDQRFLYYLLTYMNLNQYKSAGAQPGLSVKNLENLKAPVPPIMIQKRLVNVLDNFDKVCNDLHIGLPAEIETRKKQYEFYRDSLLTFLEKGGSILTDRQTDRQTELKYALIKLLQYVFGYVTVRISDVAETNIGLATSVTKYKTDKGVQLLHNSDIQPNRIVVKNYEYVSPEFAEKNYKKLLHKGDIITVHTGDVGTSAVIGDEFDGAIGFTTITTKIHNTDILMPAYLCHFLNSQKCKRQIAAMTISDRNNLNQSSFEKIRFEMPNLETQREIVRVLKNMDDLHSDISSGLPAEIEARKKQYEYYRDKLLSFKEKKG